MPSPTFSINTLQTATSFQLELVRFICLKSSHQSSYNKYAADKNKGGPTHNNVVDSAKEMNNIQNGATHVLIL